MHMNRKCTEPSVTDREYLTSLLTYLESFYTRTQPLQSLQKLFKPLEDFGERFEAGSVPEWEDRGEGRSARSSEGQIDLQAFDSTEELLTIGTRQYNPAFVAEKDEKSCLTSRLSVLRFKPAI